MRNRSSKQRIKGGSEMETEREVRDHLSGAYIRSLVKQLSSSRTKDPTTMNPKVIPVVAGEDGDDGFPPNFTKLGEEGLSIKTQQEQEREEEQQQPKKQVRRRLHTSRPYQERLLNMAEARREIVTALKFHRAEAMKKANEQHQQQQPFQTLLEPPPQTQVPQPSLEHAEKMKSWRNPRVYPSNTINHSNHILYPSLHPFPPQSHFSWASSPFATLPITENYNFSLPDQTLGLNINLHDINYNSSNNPSIYSSFSPSSSHSPLTPMEEEVPSSAAISPEEPPMIADGSGCGVGTGGLLHPAMDDEEMAEIRSIGEKHQMEWNDTLNLVTSAWWFKFLKTMEISPNSKEDSGFRPFDDVMEFPSWLNANANESCFLQQNLEDYFEDPALPRMDIGEIDGVDGEWLD